MPEPIKRKRGNPNMRRGQPSVNPNGRAAPKRKALRNLAAQAANAPQPDDTKAGAKRPTVPSTSAEWQQFAREAAELQAKAQARRAAEDAKAQAERDSETIAAVRRQREMGYEIGKDGMIHGPRLRHASGWLLGSPTLRQLLGR